MEVPSCRAPQATGEQQVIYYIYENWQAGPRKARIHRADCRHCDNGRGRSKGDSDPAHGQWHGPYDDLVAAREAQQQMPVKVRPECKHCMGGTN